MKKFNLNDQIKVKLTPRGADICYHYFDRIIDKAFQPFEHKLPPVDSKGFSTFQLWRFMEIFGQHIAQLTDESRIVSEMYMYIDENDLEDCEE